MQQKNLQYLANASSSTGGTSLITYYLIGGTSI